MLQQGDNTDMPAQMGERPSQARELISGLLLTWTEDARKAIL